MRVLTALVALGLIALVLGVAFEADRASAAGALPSMNRQDVCEGERSLQSKLNHASVVVVFPDGVDVYCVAFAEEELSGAELLEMTGLSLVLSGFGGLGSGVCKIDDVGCDDPGDCFCQCQGADCSYWTYFELTNGGWDYLPIGASQRRVRDGDVDGWVWGNGRTSPDVEQRDIVCPALSPTAEPPAAVPTATPRRQATTTPVPVQPGRQPPPAATPLDQAATNLPVAPARTPGATPTEAEVTPAAVVRVSSRPDAGKLDVDENQGDAGSGGGVSFQLVSFGAVAAALALVGIGVAVKRRLHG